MQIPNVSRRIICIKSAHTIKMRLIFKHIRNEFKTMHFIIIHLGSQKPNRYKVISSVLESENVLNVSRDRRIFVEHISFLFLTKLYVCVYVCVVCVSNYLIFIYGQRAFLMRLKWCLLRFGRTLFFVPFLFRIGKHIQ